MLAGRFIALCKPYGARLSFFSSYILILISGAINLISPFRAGFAARAVYLKYKFGVSYSYMPSLLLGSTILSWLVGGILLLTINILWTVSGTGTVSWPFWLFGFVSCSFALILTIRPPRFLTRISGKTGERINLALQGWDLIRSDYKSLTLVCIYHVLVFFVSALIINVSFYCLNISLSLPAALTISVFNTYVSVVGITPANFGIKEWSTGFLGSIAGLSFHSGVSAALLMRSLGLLINFVGGILGYYFIFIRGGLTKKSSDGSNQINDNCFPQSNI
jgi:uncharacterized membrane protein YbhN (UPF0104 family)